MFLRSSTSRPVGKINLGGPELVNSSPQRVRPRPADYVQEQGSLPENEETPEWNTFDDRGKCGTFFEITGGPQKVFVYPPPIDEG